MTPPKICASCGVAKPVTGVEVTHRRTGERAVLRLCVDCRTGADKTWRLAWVEDE